MWIAMFSSKRSVHFLLLRESDFLLYLLLVQVYFLTKQDFIRSIYNNVKNTIREERYYD